MKYFNRTTTATKHIAIAWLMLVVLTACLLFAGCSAPAQSSSAQVAREITTLDASDTPNIPNADTPGASIDFASLQAINPDVYAWIYVPDTNVNYPILQSPLADNYYLIRDMYENPSDTGAIYTQSMNAKDFSDPVTLVYGHTYEINSGLGDEMFSTLHYFEDANFFKEHPYFYVYTPTTTLTYEVAAAYEYDNRHIMNSFDFSDLTVLQDYLNFATNPDEMVKQAREVEPLIAGQDHIIQLSTCTRPANDAARYLITGVLVDEQPAA